MQAFEKTLQQWMEHFNTLLVFSCPALGQTAADVETPLDAVKAAVCQNINLFISKNEGGVCPLPAPVRTGGLGRSSCQSP